MEINEIKSKAFENAKRHKWRVNWDRTKSDITIGEALALCHSELSEALEAYRHDDHDNFNEEIADTIIRLLHLSAELDIDIEVEIIKKMNVNTLRAQNHGKANL